MKSTFLLYDDDCGICTKFAIFFSHVLQIRKIPMHTIKINELGVSILGEQEYWKSFHIVKAGKWTSEKEAIILLSGEFPMGSFIKKIVSTTLVSSILMFVLKRMQGIRNISCEFTAQV